MYKKAIEYAKKHHPKGSPEFEIAVTAFMDANRVEMTMYRVDKIILYYNNGRVTQTLRDKIETDDRGHLTKLIKVITKSKGAILYGCTSKS